jgi:protein arginine kinase activator
MIQMMCERCQKQEATIHLTQTRQGKTTEHHLCDACARELGIGHHVTDYFGTIGSLIGSGLLGGSSIFNTTGGIPAFGMQAARSATCPFCGQTFEDFRHTGLFGCSQCYEAFADRLDPVFRRVQGATRHIGGKAGLSADQREQQLLQAKLKDLKQSLQMAVAEEAYEQAARIRDEIRTMEQRLASGKDEGSGTP